MFPNNIDLWIEQNYCFPNVWQLMIWKQQDEHKFDTNTSDSMINNNYCTSNTTLISISVTATNMIIMTTARVNPVLTTVINKPHRLPPILLIHSIIFIQLNWHKRKILTKTSFEGSTIESITSTFGSYQVTDKPRHLRIGFPDGQTNFWMSATKVSWITGKNFNRIPCRPFLVKQSYFLDTTNKGYNTERSSNYQGKYLS